MRSIRIGTGAGGCSIERLEPALDLVDRGNLDYLIFECLSERTIIEAQQQKRADPTRGYNSMLEPRMQMVLPSAFAHHVRIISNMGAANPLGAVRKIAEIAAEHQLKGLRIAVVLGDDISDRIDKYEDSVLWDRDGTLADLGEILSANVYLGAKGIVEALRNNADVIITGRIADPSLFVAPLQYEYNFDENDSHMMGQAILLGHLMECCCQITGGYYYDEGQKAIQDLWNLGFPIAEMAPDGSFTITKLPGTGGAVLVDICKEQLLYEIGNPAAYITPDAIADFSHVEFTQVASDVVLSSGATSHGRTDTLKVNVGYSDSWVGIAEVSYGGTTSLARARVVAEEVQKRWDFIGIKPLERNISFIGYDSMYGPKIASLLSQGACPEVRLRVAVRARTRTEAELLVHEVQCLYINGAAGSAGIDARVFQQLSLENILVPRCDVPWEVEYLDIS